MPGGQLRIIQDSRPEEAIRKSCWRQWIILLSAMAWFLYFVTMDEPHPLRIIYPIIVTIMSVPTGWLFGYKLGIQGLFTGIYLFDKEN